MPLAIKAENPTTVCHLSTWEVADDTGLVDVLAWLYLRKPTHARRVIERLAPGKAGFFGSVFDNAIKLLTFDVNDLAVDLASPDRKTREKAEQTRDVRMHHRDGLLFQHISWIAASIQFPKAKACSPHVRKADKGFDGLIIERLGTANALTRLIICEDKASTNPRQLVLKSIWPEAKEIFLGERDLEILDAVSALLDDVPEDEREQIIADTIWDRVRQFRVALTAGPAQLKKGSYQALFTGYNNHVSGSAGGRLAEVMPLGDVRAFLDGLAGQVVNRLQQMKSNV